jgi:hypothetical protein
MTIQSRRATGIVASLFACALFAAAPSPVRAQGRNIFDPGRVFRGPENKTRDAASTPTSVTVTPMFGWSDGSQTYSGQFKWANEKMSNGNALYLAGMVSSMHFTGASRMREQFDGEYDFAINKKSAFVLSGEWGHTAQIGNDITLMPEFDWAVNDVVTIAPIMYWNQFKPTGSSASFSSTTYGVFAVVRHDDWKFIPEYDPNIGDAFEDSFSVKALWHYSKARKYNPYIFASMAKHNVFSVGTILTLK